MWPGGDFQLAACGFFKYSCFGFDLKSVLCSGSTTVPSLAEHTFHDAYRIHMLFKLSAAGLNAHLCVWPKASDFRRHADMCNVYSVWHRDTQIFPHSHTLMHLTCVRSHKDVTYSYFFNRDMLDYAIQNYRMLSYLKCSFISTNPFVYPDTTKRNSLTALSYF